MHQEQPQARAGKRRAGAMAFAQCVGTVLAVVLIAVAGYRLWSRFAPVPQKPVPVTAEVRQWSNTTCGPACVATILNVYGIGWSRSSLEEECRLTPNGTSVYDLENALRHRGIQAEGIRALNVSGLQRVARPYILFVFPGHFVVVEKIHHDQVEIFEPTQGIRQIWSAKTALSRSQGWLLSVPPPQR